MKCAQIPMIALVCLLAAVSAKAAPATLTIYDILNMEKASEFSLAPGGDRFVWVNAVADKARNKQIGNVYLTSITTGETVQMTRGTDDNSMPRFTPDGKKVSFLSARGPRAKKQIYTLDLRGGEAEVITSTGNGVDAYQWLDDQTVIFSSREDSTEYERELKKKKDTTIVVSDQAHYAPVRLFRYDLKEKKTTRVTVNGGVILEFAISPDRQWVVSNENQDIDYEYNYDNPPKQFLTSLKTGTRREICEAPWVDTYDFKWTADSKGFYCQRDYASDSTDTYVSLSRLNYYDLSDHSLAVVPIAQDNGLGQAFVVVKDGVLVALADGVYDRIAHVKRDGNKYNVRLVPNPMQIRIAAGRCDSDRVLFWQSTAATIPELIGARLDDGKFKDRKKVIEINEKLRDKTMSRREIVKWAGANGDSVDGVLFYPPFYEDGKKYPLVLSIHGGPAGNDPDFFTDRMSTYPHALAAHGSTFVFKVNYHGSSNHGLEWMESIKNHYYEYEVPDILTGVDYLIGRGFIDEERLGIMGWSNGSILAIVACIESNRFKVLCAGAGDVNWTSDYGNCGFGSGFDDAYFGGPPWEKLQQYIEKSPLFRLSENTTPTLIMFGTEDTSVPTQQGWEHFRALQRIGKVPVRFLLFPGEGHGPRKISHQTRKMEEELKWFDEHLFQVDRKENEAFREDSPLARELEKSKIKKVGFLFGEEKDQTLLPELVAAEGIYITRFEITRAQFAAFDPNYTYDVGTDNYPVNEISIGSAQAYCIWLNSKTGQRYRLPTAAEMEKLLKLANDNTCCENNLERWVGFSPTPDELTMIGDKIRELEALRLLLEPVGSFRPVGDAKIYDLGGNVAEWVVEKNGNGGILGVSAVTSGDPRSRYARPPLTYVGFRVVRE